MKHSTREEIIAFIKEHAKDVHDIVDLIISLEREYDFRTCLVTRSDVQDEFEESWQFDSNEGERREMTEEEWQKFRSDWFWSKGHSEVMWDGVIEAIRWDLRELDLVPKDTVSE